MFCLGVSRASTEGPSWPEGPGPRGRGRAVPPAAARPGLPHQPPGTKIRRKEEAGHSPRGSSRLSACCRGRRGGGLVSRLSIRSLPRGGETVSAGSWENSTLLLEVESERREEPRVPSLESHRCPSVTSTGTLTLDWHPFSHSPPPGLYHLPRNLLRTRSELTWAAALV